MKLNYNSATLHVILISKIKKESSTELYHDNVAFSAAVSSLMCVSLQHTLNHCLAVSKLPKEIRSLPLWERNRQTDKQGKRESEKVAARRDLKRSIPNPVFSPFRHASCSEASFSTASTKTHTHAHARTRTHIQTHTHSDVYTHAHTHTHTHTHTPTYTHRHTHTLRCVHTRTRTHSHLHTHTYTHTHTHLHTHTRAHTHTHRHTHTRFILAMKTSVCELFSLRSDF